MELLFMGGSGMGNTIGRRYGATADYAVAESGVDMGQSRRRSGR